MWSLGVVFFEIWSLGSLPYSDLKNDEVSVKVLNGGTLTVPPRCPAEIASIVNSCFAFKAESRPNFHKLSQDLIKVANQLAPGRESRRFTGKKQDLAAAHKPGESLYNTGNTKQAIYNNSNTTTTTNNSATSPAIYNNRTETAPAIYNNGPSPSSPPIYNNGPQPSKSVTSQETPLYNTAPVGTTVAVALFDYHSDTAGHLNFNKGSKVEVEKQDPSGWWLGSVNGTKGIFPGNRVELSK